MNRTYQIAAIVVTYNRKDCLVQCVKALATQTYLPATIIIVDNASTDGTMEALHDNGFNVKDHERIRYGKTEIMYERLEQNMGGAGGFYHGIKTGYEMNLYDAFWVMDDDGLPHRDSLKHMVGYLDHFDYISPLCLATENHAMLAFDHKGVPLASDYIARFAVDGVVHHDAYPFNGVMYSRAFVEKVGLPRKEFFIWGDEANYHRRGIAQGFEPVVIVDALHYHPLNRAEYYDLNMLGKKRRIILTNSLLRLYCMHRNAAVNALMGSPCKAAKNLILRYLVYSKYYLSIEKSFRHWKVFNNAFFAGLFGLFEGHKKYLKH